MAIRKIPNGRYQAIIRKKGFPTQSRVFARKGDAQKWESEILAEMNKGVFVSRSEAEATALNELFQRFIDEYVPRLADPTRQANRVKALMRRDIGKRIVATIKNADIAAFIKEREAEGVSGNTIRLDLAVISRVFNVARANWGFASLSNPVEHVIRPKVAKGRERRIRGPKEWKALLKASSPRFRLVLRFALRTAMRREEIADLTWDRVFFDKRTLWLPKTKNGEQRLVPLSPKAIAILYQAGPRSEGSVFGMTPAGITKAMVRAARDAGIEDLHFHDLRHEAVSRFFEMTDLDVMEIKSVSGHKTLQMLNRYSHIRIERLAARLAGAKRGAPEKHGPNVIPFSEAVETS